jgi:AraC-like DNA-binding protein
MTGTLPGMLPTLSSDRAAGSRRSGEPPVAAAPVAYRELAPPPALAPWVRCLWRLAVTGQGGPDRVVPDGFMDLVASGPAVTLAGPDTGPWPVRRTPGTVTVGVRFHPGAAPSLLGPPAVELRDTRVTPDQLWGRTGAELAERVADAPAPAARLAAMVAGLTARLDGAARPDPLVAAAVARLEADPAGAPVGALGPAVGLGERQLRRRFLAGVGYGPKTLARVLRFQRLLALLRDPAGPPTLAEAALAAGYADQAHMTAECASLAGRSPATLAAGR